MPNLIKMFVATGGKRGPFDNKRLIRYLGAQRVATAEESDVIVAHQRHHFDEKHIDSATPLVLWTHEPFIDSSQHFIDQKAFERRALFICNAHNGLIYTDNFFLIPQERSISRLELDGRLNVNFEQKGLVMSASFKRHRLFVNGRDRSLLRRRVNMATELHRSGHIRIIGQRWPEGMAEGSSRYENRFLSKGTFFSQANFSLVFENAEIDYYITEKIWEAVQFGTLPIFGGSDTIYQTFPRNSFIDVKQFTDGKELMDFINNLSLDEYIQRRNTCRQIVADVYNEKFDNKSEYRAMRLFRVLLDSIL